MRRVLALIMGLFVSFSFFRCGNNQDSKEDRPDNRRRYPWTVEDPVDVYFGPQHSESPDVSPEAPVYHGPQHSESPDVSPEAPVYFGPQGFDDEPSEKPGYPDSTEEPADVYFGPQFSEDD